MCYDYTPLGFVQHTGCGVSDNSAPSHVLQGLCGTEEGEEPEPLPSRACQALWKKVLCLH